MPFLLYQHENFNRFERRGLVALDCLCGRPQPLSISLGAWGGMWGSTELPDKQTGTHRNGNSLVWHTGVGTENWQCQARSGLGHGAGSRASWAEAWLLYKHPVSSLPLQLLFSCLLFPFPVRTPGGTSPTNSGQTGAQAIPRMLPRLYGPPITLLEGSRVSCRSSGLGQRKSTPSSPHVSQKGPLPPSCSSWHAGQWHSRKTVTAGSACLEEVSAQHHGGSAHSAILFCRNLIQDHFSSTFSPHPDGEWEPHTLVCTVPDSYCTAGPGGTILQFAFILMYNTTESIFQP